MLKVHMDETRGVFMLSEPVNALTENQLNNSHIIDDMDLNQLTTNSEDLRQLSRDVKQFSLLQKQQEEKKQHQRNRLEAPPRPRSMLTMSHEGSMNIYEQTEDEQRAAINREVDKEHQSLLAADDECYGWVMVLGSLLCMIVVDGFCFTYGLHCNWIRRHFSLSSLVTTMLPGSLISGLYMITSPFANPLASYFDYRKVAMAGCVMATVGIFISSFCNSYGAFVGFFGILSGVGFGLMYLPAIAIVAHWFNRLRAVAIGVALCGSGIGTCLLAFLVPVLIRQLQGPGCLVILAALCLQTLVVIALFRPYELHQQLKQMRKDYSEWCVENADFLQERKWLRNQKKIEKRLLEKQIKRDKDNRNKKIVIQRGSIFTKIMEEKNRQRNVSTGSLDGMLITQNNQLVPGSQVDMHNGGAARSFFQQQQMPGSTSATSLSSAVLLHPRSYDRVVEATLKALKKSPNRNYQPVSRSLSKKSSMNSMNQSTIDGETGNEQIPMHLVKEYMEKQRFSLRDDVESAYNEEMTFKVGSTLLMNDPNGSGLLPTGTGEDSATVSLAGGYSQSAIGSSVQQQRSSATNAAAAVADMALPPEIRRLVREHLLKELTRPANRRDLYYPGSLHQLVNTQLPVTTGRFATSISKISAVTEITPHRFSCPAISSQKRIDETDYQGDSNGSGLTNNSYNTGVLPSTDNKTVENEHIFYELFDFQLLRSFGFLLLSISSITMMFGFFVPFYFLPLLLESENMMWTSGILSALGFSNILGRLIATVYIEKGWAFTHKKANGSNLTVAFLATSSISIIAMPYLYRLHVAMVVVLGFVYGFSIAMIVSIRSMLVVELFGIENLTKSFTFLLIFQGLASIVGPILSGCICDNVPRDFTTDAAFIFSGLCFVISTICIIILQQIKSPVDVFQCSSTLSSPNPQQISPENLRNPSTSYPRFTDFETPEAEAYDPQNTQTTNLMSLSNSETRPNQSA